MGIDVGTTGVKAAVFDETGTMLGYGIESYGVELSEGKRAEQDAEKVWACTKETMRAAVSGGGGDIAAISVSTQGDAVIPIDKERNSLHNAILGMDYRTGPEARRCASLFGDQALFEHTGMRPHPLNSLTKIMWFEANADFGGRLYKYATFADYILLKLGSDAPVIDLSMASRTMALDLKEKRWSPEILGKLGIDTGLLSEPIPSGMIVGELSKSLCFELGIRAGAKLVSGGHDQPCAALGAGVVDEGIALDSHGTAEVLSTSFLASRLGEAMYSGYYPCTYHVVPDRFFTFALNHTGGILLQWLRDTLCGEDVAAAKACGMDPYTYIIERAPDGPSRVLILPHFNGSGTPWCDLKSKGAFVGLTMDTTRGDLVKAMLDSLTYEMRINLRKLEDADIKVRRLRCVGGAARSEKWMRIKADGLGCTVETLLVREAACLGAAMLAASAVGAYSSILEALVMVQLEKRFEPDEDGKRAYEKRFRIYCDLYEALRAINHEL